ncbi:uncharacterized protein BDV17DRAFT_263934 [Aspergillus undulatus]|uniref:uncharacterized protein n=1 Tax=Aspergillus undulatus TaxID=1810928 RepID=UPI003CCDDE12
MTRTCSLGCRASRSVNVGLASTGSWTACIYINSNTHPWLLMLNPHCNRMRFCITNSCTRFQV